MTRHNKPTFPVTDSAQTEGGYGDPQYVPRAIPPHIGVRQPVPITSDDLERQPLKFIALALTHLKNEISKMAVMIEDRSRPVDEYQPQEVIGETETTIVIQPQWDTTERITTVVIVGPPAGTPTLQLGDRVWPLVIPASGILVIAPINIFLTRSDTRQLTVGTPGQYSVHLGGYADSRGQLI